MDAFDRIAAPTPLKTRRLVAKMLDVAERIHAILEVRGMTQNGLAQAMGKSELEISNWLTGLHTLELKTIARIEEVLEEEILSVPKTRRSGG